MASKEISESSSVYKYDLTLTKVETSSKFNFSDLREERKFIWHVNKTDLICNL